MSRRPAHDGVEELDERGIVMLRRLRRRLARKFATEACETNGGECFRGVGTVSVPTPRAESSDEHEERRTEWNSRRMCDGGDRNAGS
jgi:hypothetical protein